MIGIEKPVISSQPARASLTGRDLPATGVVNLKRWIGILAVSDALAAGVGVVTLLLARFGADLVPSNQLYYRGLAVALVPAWLVTLLLSGSYDRRYFAAGAEQYRRVIHGALWLLAVIAFAAFAMKADVSRGLVIFSLPYIAVLTIIARWIVRKSLQRQFADNRAAHRVLAVGSPTEVSDLATHMRRASYSGFRVVAAVVPGHSEASQRLPEGVMWGGNNLDSIVATAVSCGADTVALAGPHLLQRGGLRRLSWQLEDTAIDLVVVPAMTDIAGPRIHIRPVEGLPLLHIDRPQFSGIRWLVKASLDRFLALFGLFILCPLLLVTALAVKLTSRGSVLFSQTRVGLKGKEFRLLKFRTMVRGAEDTRDAIGHLNHHDGVLFKIRDDPRVTRVGRFLRRWSIDELPQLWNVVRGDMSLVGPRPPLPDEVERYGIDVHRRLLVKPGITGMWQVSGRADLSWDESVRLDLHYVDHWSVGLDFILLWKTLLTVVRGRGAY